MALKANKKLVTTAILATLAIVAAATYGLNKLHTITINVKEPLSISLFNPTVDLYPGETGEATILTIQNLASVDYDLTYSFEVKSGVEYIKEVAVYVDDEEVASKLIDNENTSGNLTFDLPAGKTAEVKVTVIVPKDEESGPITLAIESKTIVRS